MTTANKLEPVGGPPPSKPPWQKRLLHHPLMFRRGDTGFGEHHWSTAAVITAAILLLPILSLFWIAFGSDRNVWPHLAATVLPTALSNTFLLMAGAGFLAIVIGTATAWIVTMYRFHGRALADRLLVLPLAMPVYIVAYAYVDLLDYAGPVQTALRDGLGLSGPGDYIFPEVRSLSGAILMFALSLYPYVYLTARASFEQQSVCVLEVARTLGRTGRETFWAVALPLARPALVAGVMLVLMESLNDLGAVQYLGVETLSASIFSTWTQRASLAGAAQISLVMLVVIAALLMGERALRGAGGVKPTTGRYRAIPFETLSGWRGGAALMIVITPVILGFAIPFLVLLTQTMDNWRNVDGGAFARAALNSVVLASLVSVVAITIAMLFAYSARIARNRATKAANRLAGLGYALPGTVLAIGMMTPLAAFDNTIDQWMRAVFGISTGLLLSGSLFAVTAALVIRFLAVALGSVDAGLERMSTSLDFAARTLGANTLTTLRRIHLPILAPALGAAALMVFVDAMKELPATLLLRPFNFETLATHVYGLTAAERFEDATPGAITIVLIGLLPVLWLHKTIADGRAGSQST